MEIPFPDTLPPRRRPVKYSFAGYYTSKGILSTGVNSGNPTVLYYEPTAAASNKIPESYTIDEYYLEYTIEAYATNNFLEVLIGRLELQYNIPGFQSSFITYFENFLASVDVDEELEGLQPYTTPWETPILTLADTQWFGPANTWPSETYNYSYIQFWHKLNQRLAEESSLSQNQKLLNDTIWTLLFPEGPLAENSAITMAISHEPESITISQTDQLDNDRPSGPLGDIGSIEM